MSLALIYNCYKIVCPWTTINTDIVGFVSQVWVCVPNKHFPRRAGNEYTSCWHQNNVSTNAVNVSIPSAPKGNNDDVDWRYLVWKKKMKKKENTEYPINYVSFSRLTSTKNIRLDYRIYCKFVEDNWQTAIPYRFY